MKVRLTYYIYFWLINSLMAFGTGIIAGLTAWRLFTAIFNEAHDTVNISIFIITITSLCFLFFYQFFILSFFWGKRRGEFEYSFLEKTAKGEKEVWTWLRKVNLELKYSDQNSAHIKLQEAIKIYPSNFVLQFRYAISCERIGEPEDAIGAYEKALKLISEASEALRSYVNNQINRIKIKGPSKGAKVPGLQYVLY